MLIRIIKPVQSERRDDGTSSPLLLHPFSTRKNNLIRLFLVEREYVRNSLV